MTLNDILTDLDEWGVLDKDCEVVTARLASMNVSLESEIIPMRHPKREQLEKLREQHRPTLNG